MLSVVAARLAYEDFYRALGTTVDEVGVSTWQMLTPAVVVLLALAPLAWISVYIAVAISRLQSEWYEKLALGIAVTGAAFVGLIKLVPASDSWTRGSAAAGGFAVLLSISHVQVVENREQLRLTFRWFLVAAATLAFFMWMVSSNRAGQAGLELPRDGSLRSFTGVLLDPALRPVCVRPLASDVRAAGVPVSRPLLLLGGNEADFVLRDVKRQSTLRLPVEAAVLTTPRQGLCA